MHIKTGVAAVCVCAWVFMAAPARGATIGLPTPLTGGSSTPFVDLTVSFDANGSGATNVTGWELYVAFSGLTPIDSSFALGSIFEPFSADVIELHGTCGDGAPCSDPPADTTSFGQWVSLASVFAPHVPTGPGTLFTVRFAVTPGLPDWSLDVFGEAADVADPCGVSSALLWEHPTDGTCAIVPFVVVPEGTAVARGTARLAVSAAAVTPPVPEPSAILLLSAGVAGLLTRRRSR